MTTERNRLKEILTAEEFSNLRKALYETGMKNPEAANRKILTHLSVKQFRETVVGAVFRKVVPRVNYVRSVAGLVNAWYKPGCPDRRFKFNEALAGEYIQEASSQSPQPPPKKRRRGPSNGVPIDTPGTNASPHAAPVEPEYPVTGERYEFFWTHICNEYLTFPDVMTLFRTNRALQRIARGFLKIEIDPDFLAQYPFTQYNQMYSTLGRYIEIISLKSLSGDMVQNIFEKFPNLTEVTMRDCGGGTNKYGLRDVHPEKIRKLKLFNCQLDDSFLSGIPKKCNNLTWLHISESQDAKPNRIVAFLRNLPDSSKESLEHLSVEVAKDRILFPNGYRDPPFKNLVRLEISWTQSTARNTERLVATNLPALKHLRLCFPPNHPDIKNLSLKLVQHSIPGQSIQPLLDRVRNEKYQQIDLQIICYPSDEEWKKLNPSGVNLIETVDYSANPKPIDDNFIFGKLDDSILLKIISYLPVGACLSLACSHEYFRRIFQEDENRWEQVSLTRNFTCNYPIKDMKSGYETLFRNTCSLSLSNTMWFDTPEILSCFKQLKHLAIEKVSLTDFQDHVRLPRNLESLELKYVKIRKVLWSRWCRILNRSLRVLTIHCYDNFPDTEEVEFTDRIAGLRLLKNIREFSFTGPALPMYLKRFLSANKDHLEHLKLRVTTELMSAEESRAIVGIFPTLKKLKVLHACGFPNEEYEQYGPICLPQVTDLTCDGWAIGCFRPIATNLRKLQLASLHDNLGWSRIDLRPYINLEYLHYQHDRIDRSSLISLAGLRHFSNWYCGNRIGSEQETLQLIKDLPQINRLSTKKSQYSEQFMTNLAAYLESQRRAFRFNNVVYDGRGSSRLVDDDDESSFGQRGDPEDDYWWDNISQKPNFDLFSHVDCSEHSDDDGEFDFNICF